MDEDERGESVLLPRSLIVELPQSHSEKQKFIESFKELLEKGNSVDPDTVGSMMWVSGIASLQSTRTRYF